MNEPAPPTLAHSRFEYGYIPGINQGGQLQSGESASEACLCLVGWELGRHEVVRKLAFVPPSVLPTSDDPFPFSPLRSRLLC